jgi:hypothetical protein
MIRNLKRCAALLTALALGACKDELVVTNPDQPDAGRALSSPGDVENMMGGYYKRWHEGLYRNLGNVEGMANVMSFQNFSSLANNCQNGRLPFSGAFNDNSIGNVCKEEQQRVYFVESEVNRVATTLMAKVLNDKLDIGQPGTTARNNRFLAFGEFLRGISLGYLAMFYDSAAVVTVGQASADPGELSDYKVVFDTAMAAFQRAIDYANAPSTGGDGFPLPAGWIPSPTTFTAQEFIRLVRSYRARIRANVARTPAERAAVNWDQVIADAQNGITSDHFNTTNSVSGPFRTWVQQYETYGLWHQMPPFVIGMADVSGSYAAWIAQPVGERGSGNQSFTMVTPDLRFPQGATRAAQQADFAITSCQDAATPCKRYFVNRPAGGDQFAGSGWGWSNYDFVRFHSWRVSGDAGAGRNGNLPFFTKVELAMLQAEGLIRKGQFAQAAALINVTRVKNGLPPITEFNATAPVPGGANCVPKVPVAPYNVIACGNMFEAMKWEKRIETAYTHFAPWFLDGRGWGDLAEGTALFWAVPYQDLQARGVAISAIYGAGAGVGTAANSAAAKGTYGW